MFQIVPYMGAQKQLFPACYIVTLKPEFSGMLLQNKQIDIWVLLKSYSVGFSILYILSQTDGNYMCIWYS